MQPCAIGIAMSSLISGFSKARMLFFWGKTNFNANLLINICRSATVIRSEDVASSEEEADANEVVENSVCLFPQNFIVYENNLDCVVFLPNHFMICFYSQMSAGRGECATNWT